MTQREAVNHLQNRSRAELKAAKALFEKEDVDLYGEVLFHCHLALELALKASYVREKDAAAPFTHDLGELADALSRRWTPDEQDVLEEITECGILSRYGDEEWYATHATRATAEKCLRDTEQFLSAVLQS